jgi:hypothetical protein
MVLYDYIAIGVLIISVLTVLWWARDVLVQTMIGSIILMIVTLWLHFVIDISASILLLNPAENGLFLLTNTTVAGFLSSAKLVIIIVMIAFLGWQLIYGSRLGVMPDNHRTYKLWSWLQIPLGIILVYGLGMLVWAGPIFFTTDIVTRAAWLFSEWIIRLSIQRLPVLVTLTIIITIVGTTTFSRLFVVNISMHSTNRERDAIYVEREEID